MVKTIDRSHGINPEDLLQSGLDHLHAARILFGSAPAYFDSAGYLMHLAVELLLKAWLLHETDQFKAIHPVVNLYSKLVAAKKAQELSSELQETLELVDLYGQLRYPNPNEPTEVGSDDLEKMDRLVEHILTAMPQISRKTQNPSGFVEKGGRRLMKMKIPPAE